MEFGGIQSIFSRTTNQANFGSFINTRLIVPLFWYWDDNTLNNVVNSQTFRQSIHFQTIYRYAENKLKLWLKDIDDLVALGVPTFGYSQYRVPSCTIQCARVVGDLIYDCEFKMGAKKSMPMVLASDNDRIRKGHVETESITAGNDFWIENYGMTHESLSSISSHDESNTATQSMNSTFRAISSILVQIKDVDNGYKTQTKLNLQRIPRAVSSFVASNFWKNVATIENDSNNEDKHGSLLLSDLPPRIKNFELDGASEFLGTISFDHLPISTETVAFTNSQVTMISLTKKIDTRSQLSTVSVLSPNLRGNLDLQLFECFRRKIATKLKFNKHLSQFKVKNDREYYCKLE